MLVLLVPSYSASIHFIQGGIPVIPPAQLVEEGMRLGNVDYLRRAWSHYENSVNLGAGMNKGYLELGKIYFYLSLLGDSTQNDFDKANKYVTKAVINNPDSADAHHAMGLILAGRGAYLDGLQELTLAANLKPGDEFLICDLAMLHLAAHEPKKAISLLEGKSLKTGWSYIVLAMAWSQENQKGKAILNLLKAKKSGYTGYWLNEMTKRLSAESGLKLD